MADLVNDIADYLITHWKNCYWMRDWEREKEVAYYETLPDPYGKGFAQKLRAKLKKELQSGQT